MPRVPRPHVSREHRAGIRDAVLDSVVLAVACLVAYLLVTKLLSRLYFISRDDDLLGGMWAVIATIFGQPNFSGLSFTLNHSHFDYGEFLNALVAFLSVAVAIFFFVVKPVNVLTRRLHPGPDAGSQTRPCTECLSAIPLAARRCAFCTSIQTPATEPAPQ